MTKYVAYHSSRGAPVDELLSRCTRTLDRAVAGGVDRAAEQAARAPGPVLGPGRRAGDAQRQTVRTQQAVRWNLFQLCQATWCMQGGGVPAKGLTGQAYDGHYFWDTEIYVLPFLAYTQPRLARNLLRFRYSMLDTARARGRQLEPARRTVPVAHHQRRGGVGQLPAGHRAVPHQRRHRLRDPALLPDPRATTGFLAEIGAEMLVETARLWEDLGFYGDDGRFHIHGVTGPDEYTTVVNDNTYTNLMARLNLTLAAATVRWLAGRTAAGLHRAASHAVGPRA